MYIILIYSIVVLFFLANFYFGKLSWSVRDSWFVRERACGEVDQSQRSAQQTSASEEKKHERSLSHSDPPAQLTDIHLALFHPYFDPRLSGKLSNPEEDGEVRI